MRIISVLIIALSILSCSDDNCSPEIKSYRFYDGQLNVDTSLFIGFEIIESNNLLFEYAVIGEECEDISDDERSMRIVFQIEVDSIVINASNEEITSIYRDSGAWSNYTYVITTSSVKATRESDDRYKIEAKFTYEDISGEEVEIEINENFVRE